MFLVVHPQISQALVFKDDSILNVPIKILSFYFPNGENLHFLSLNATIVNYFCILSKCFTLFGYHALICKPKNMYIIWCWENNRAPELVLYANYYYYPRDFCRASFLPDRKVLLWDEFLYFIQKYNVLHDASSDICYMFVFKNKLWFEKPET